MTYRFEPFDKAVHSREAFDSGVEAVNNYIQKTASKLDKADNVRFFVMVDIEDPKTIVGFYTLNAHVVRASELPAKYEKSAASHGGIPSAFISMMGVRRDRQGQGIGALVLTDALKRIVVGAESIGTAVVLLDVLNCNDAEAIGRRHEFYARFGFAKLETQPDRLFLPVASIRKSFQLAR